MLMARRAAICLGLAQVIACTPAGKPCAEVPPELSSIVDWSTAHGSALPDSLLLTASLIEDTVRSSDVLGIRYAIHNGGPEVELPFSRSYFRFQIRTPRGETLQNLFEGAMQMPSMPEFVTLDTGGFLGGTQMVSCNTCYRKYKLDIPGEYKMIVVYESNPVPENGGESYAHVRLQSDTLYFTYDP